MRNFSAIPSPQTNSYPVSVALWPPPSPARPPVYLRREERRRRAPPRFGIDEHIEGLSKYKFARVPDRHGGYETIVKNYIPDGRVKKTTRERRAGTKATTKRKAPAKKDATKKAGTRKVPTKKSTKKAKDTKVGKVT